MLYTRIHGVDNSRRSEILRLLIRIIDTKEGWMRA